MRSLFSLDPIKESLQVCACRDVRSENQSFHLGLSMMVGTPSRSTSSLR